MASIAPPTVSDARKRKAKAAIVAGLLLIYRGTKRKTLAKRGIYPKTVTVPTAARKRLTVYATERAEKFQNGVDIYGKAALNKLPNDATAEQKSAALAASKREMTAHNAGVLIPLLTSYATHQSVIDTLSELPSAGDPSKSVAETALWNWTQNRDYVDECTDADAASPATLDELLAITGSIPPVHDRCACVLSLA